MSPKAGSRGFESHRLHFLAGRKSAVVVSISPKAGSRGFESHRLHFLAGRKSAVVVSMSPKAGSRGFKSHRLHFKRTKIGCCDEFFAAEFVYSRKCSLKS